ncbi:MAG: ABC transporter ATP-binding protein [Natronohydrobacter sp.]|nr:ABC transporter ATP-binding protein [Natronohydrobacter sp.]
MHHSTALPISISAVTKAYGAVHALKGVSLDIQAGEFMTLLGPSGSGKTTLLMAIAGFTRPDSGSIRFGDQEAILSPPHKRGVGMVFQNYALFPHMNVARNVAYPLKLRKVAKAEVDAMVAEALETVQLAGYGDRAISQLSGGQKQRVALARAIVFKPRILLMDEPLSALDKKLREHMQIELRHLHEKLGMTTVYVTHDQREALTMADRIAVINHGSLQQVDTPRKIYESPANRFVADFIGESSILPVVRDGNTIRFDGNALKTVTAPPDGPLALMIRPERLAFVTDASRDEVNTFAGNVLELVYQGDSALCYIELSNGTTVALRANTHAGGPLDSIVEGASVTLGLHVADTVLIPAGRDA